MNIYAPLHFEHKDDVKIIIRLHKANYLRLVTPYLRMVTLIFKL